MNYRKDDSQLTPKLNQQPQQRNRIRSAGNRDAYTVSRPQQIMFLNVCEHRFCQLVHGSMLHRHEDAKTSRPIPRTAESELDVKSERADADVTLSREQAGKIGARIR